MSYTKEQRRKIHEALIRLKDNLWDGVNDANWFNKHTYICGAANGAPHETLVQKMIRERLGFSRTVEEWLEENVVGFEFDRFSYWYFNTPLTSKDIQDYRHRWVDALIVEFSK